MLRDPLTFTIRERRNLLGLRGTPEQGADLTGLLALLLGSWSFDHPLPPDADALAALAPADRAALRDAVLAELPELQRTVHPAPGWRTRS